MSLFCCLVAEASDPAPGTLEAVARACSPRVEPDGAAAVVFDASGLARMFGTPEQLAQEVVRLAGERGVRVRLALAGAATTARLLAHARPGVTIVSPGQETLAVAPLPVAALRVLPDLAAIDTRLPRRRMARAGAHDRAAPGLATKDARVTSAGLIATLTRWGLRTLGEVARLPRADLHARFGDPGVRLHRAVRGEDADPLVPAGEPREFRERLDLEWPVDGLEPLAFVLARVCDALAHTLERADRGAVVVRTRLTLTTRAVHERRLELPAPMRDARLLRTLVLIDLEGHPPPAGVDAVEVDLDVAPGAVGQGSLLAMLRGIAGGASAETLATLVARLGALVGESRVGAPTRVASHDARAVAMQPFVARREARVAAVATAAPPGRPGLRRWRPPRVVRVRVERGRPVRVEALGIGVVSDGRIVMAAGPWRSSGGWWELRERRAPSVERRQPEADERERAVRAGHAPRAQGPGPRADAAWDRDEWDVVLADGRACLLSHDRASGLWEIEAEID